MNRKKILFINHASGITGASKSLSLITNNLDKSQYEIILIFLKTSPALKLFNNYDKIECISKRIFYFNHTSNWVKINNIHIGILQLISWIHVRYFIAPKIYKKYKPDLVYLNSSVLTDWLVAAKKQNFKAILHVREAVSSGYFGLRKNIIKQIINKYADKIIFISKHNYEVLKTDISKTSIIYNSVCLENINKAEKKYDLIYVGGDHKIKGFEFLVKNLPNLSDYKICMLGHYSSKNIDRLKIYDNISLYGYSLHPEKYICESKILVFPAITPHFPRPIIEAMMLGTICISSDLSGINELIEDSINGFLFESENKKSFIETINKVYLLNELHKNEVLFHAERFAKENFILENNNKRIVEIVRVLLDIKQ